VLEGADDIGSKCAACGKTEGKLMKCTGCEISAYCGKVILLSLSCLLYSYHATSQFGFEFDLMLTECVRRIEQECQVKGWSEMDHKSNCKVLRALQDFTV
jgi:hypothetical protein